jgi:outer membrane protein assembly factor BamB
MNATANEPDASTPQPAAARPIRLWPITAVVLLYWAWRVWARHADLATVVRFGTDFGTAVLLGLLFVGWWTISRRVPRGLKWPALGAFLAAGVTAALVADRTVHPIVMTYFGLPVVTTAWLAGLYLARAVRPPAGRRVVVLAAIVLAWAGMAAVRFEGTTGEQVAALRPRWTATAEEQYLAAVRAAPRPPAATGRAASPLAVSADDWPAFRGAARDGIVRGTGPIRTDWGSAPPRLVWRGASGPGWSSPVIVGDRVLVHEQRGTAEAVVCRDLGTGAEVWAHEDPGRFDESVGGPGPRATPTAVGDKLYTFGATGRLNCLNLADGRVVWSRDAVADTAGVIPMWALSSSPLVVGSSPVPGSPHTSGSPPAPGGVVFVWTGNPDRGLAAFRAADGQPAWNVPAGKSTYTSAQLATLGGKEQVLFLGDAGLTAVDPADGKVLWEYAAPAPNSTRSVQPIAVGLSQVLISSELDIGVAALDVTAEGGGWRATERWRSRALKPSFNDFVVHDGHLYGFDGPVFGCASLETGQRVWRGGRYGHGQVVLLADAGALVVAAEDGDAVAVRATPAGHEELGRFKAVEGKVWAHPAVAHGKLVVRSDRETACFDLGSAADGGAKAGSTW